MRYSLFPFLKNMAKRWDKIRGYSQWIEGEKNSCTCEYGSLWKGNKKNPCRHMRLMMIKLGDKYKEMLKELVDFKCEQCKQKFLPHELIIHRIIRGNKGGKYIPSNIKIFCINCHKLIHAGENRRTKI